MQPIYDFVADARKNKQPFFVWYAPLLPHDPHTPPERLLKKYQSQTDSIHVAKYWAMVEWFDETCGQLLDHLDSQGLANDTIVVYVTDNGWIQNPNGPKYAERSKQSPFDGGLRTPIMIRWPGKVAAVKESALASSLDLLPTLLTAVGIDLPPNLSGINLLDDAAVKARNTLYGECFTQDIRDLNNPDASLRYRWIISGNWKLIQPHPALEPNEPVRLFNILNDPLEEQNLAEQHPDTVAELQSKLDDWYRPK
jgi:uncharacterized sulfatase